MVVIMRIVMMVTMMMAMVSIAMMVFMTVMPQLGFVEQEEKEQTKQQRDKQVVGFNASLEGFGQQVQKGCGEQSACSQTEHVLRVAAHNAKAEPRRKPHTANASGQGAQQNRQ
jgi:flagellar basal body-associated protein FliL